MIDNIKKFNLDALNNTKYLFLTGKGGVGKTSLSCAIAVKMADEGKKVLLISTDPASNLQDVFEVELKSTETVINHVPNLSIINVNPMEAAEEYRNEIVDPYRGLLPEDAIKNMEEQLSGSCTVEVASFNEFVKLITDSDIQARFDHIIFDTAPTGHTLRMLELPSAWTNFLDENTTGASCLGQLSGLGDQREQYREAVATLSNQKLTTMILVARPQVSPIIEAGRSSLELEELGIKNQLFVINALLETADDKISSKMLENQHNALSMIPDNMHKYKTYYIPMKPFNVTGIERVRQFLTFEDNLLKDEDEISDINFNDVDILIDDLYNTNKKVIFTMGKGGVGKTTLASKIAKGLIAKGLNVHLTTTDPANHLDFVSEALPNLTISHIDEEKALEEYREDVLSRVRGTISEDDLLYIEEDLTSPCTQEIAVFREFAEIVDKADNEVVIIDTAPTGHTLLLLESTQSYTSEISRSNGEIPESIYKLLPRLKNKEETEVIIVTLPETTPVFEALRLKEDLERAEINNKWWVINQSLYVSGIKNNLLKARARSEKEWIDKVEEISKGNFVIIPWNDEDK